jgi:reversibly glycosylated polypeptide/UDP-arabinopyranose mutase
MPDKRVALVIPTIRENSFKDFISRWEALGLYQAVDLIVMEDNPTKTFDMKIDPRWSAVHLCWEDIEADFGKDAWVIPRRSDTVRSYAYHYAWKMGYDYILTLDDDCYPPGQPDGLQYKDGVGFVQSHIQYLEKRNRWFNTLNKVKPRGIPFYNIGHNDRVIVNHGLWTNVLDYDAPFQLANPIPEEFSFDNRIVPNGQYFPMCGMNVMWKREATVLMYHLLMGHWQDPKQYDHPQLVDAGMSKYQLTKLPFDRFGDIWCGIIMKKIADVKRLQVSSGMPYIRHERASNPFTNLKKEANGIEVNEKFWEYVDKAQISPGLDLDGMYGEMGLHIAKYEEFPEHKAYFKLLGDAMVRWSKLFKEYKPAKVVK